ncbi:hypothetical protein DVH24_021517 [Malus domestica]|uniref:Glycosyltransferase n=1 Tax=Malus domestica TaxID=3750 RepID=A0A498JX05_MALDO|nr:hypothetical protein DVH24_021517 [Malus domestica]
MNESQECNITEDSCIFTYVRTVFALCFPSGFLSISNPAPILNRRFAKSIAQVGSSLCESSERINLLKSEFVAASEKNAELKKLLRELILRSTDVHLLNLTQSQKADQNSSGAEGHRVTVEEKKLMNGNGSSLVVPRQFMDLGHGERFGSLGDNVKAAGHSDDQRIGFDHEKKDFGRRIGREESPDQPSQSWGLNKVPRLNSPKENQTWQPVQVHLQKKAGPFGTVKGLLTNPSVLPDESVNPRLAKILEKVAVNRELIVALANSNVKEMLEVWFANINRVGISNYLVVALDDEIARFCELKNVPVYKRDPNKVIDSVATRTGGNHAVSGLKFRVLREFLQLGYSVLLSDVDIVYLQDPFNYLYHDSDVESMTAYGYNDGFDEPGMGWARYAHTMRIWVYNSGFFYIRPTIPSIELWDRVANRLSKEQAWDQAVFNQENKVLLKTVRKDAKLSKLKPVIVHLNYHPDKHPRMLAIMDFYVNGKQDELKPFPDGSEW